MYGLTRDFIRNGGSFMVLEKAEGLRMDELSRVQMGMLSSNQIPRLLPVHIREVDRNVTLQYDISGYKMLPQMLKSGKIKLRVLYGLLFQLADTFTECRQYMLDSRKLQIQEEYIYINGSLEIGELGLVYIPIVDAVEVDPTPQQFRELVIRLMAHVQELQGEGIQRVLQLCDSEQWDIRQLRELLLELYADEQNGSGQASFMSSRGSSGSTDSELGMSISAIPERGNEPFSKRSGQDHQYRQSDGNSEAEQQSKSFQQPRVSNTEEDKALNKPFSGFSRRRSPIESSLQSKDVTNPSQRQTFDSLQDDNMEKDEKQGSSKTTYIILGCMIAMALVWRFIYMEQPGQTQMILSAALSAGLLGIAGWAWVTKGKFGNSKSNLLRKKIPNEEYADGELQEGSSNKRSALFGLGRGKDKQKESEEEMFQESWRWNASEMSPEGNAYAQGYTSQQSSGDMQSQSAQSERGHYFESRSPVAGNSRFQNLHISSEASDEPFVQHTFEATAATSELFHQHAAADATVNLQSIAGGSIGGAGPVVPSFYLERRSATGEKNERMDVRGASFVIGRSADMVQWVDSATGVSRAHVELSRNKAGYVIKDLGSVNGTILKGNVLAPYKEYPLEDGDTFTLAESVYTYRLIG